MGGKIDESKRVGGVMNRSQLLGEWHRVRKNNGPRIRTVFNRIPTVGVVIGRGGFQTGEDAGTAYEPVWRHVNE